MALRAKSICRRRRRIKTNATSRFMLAINRCAANPFGATDWRIRHLRRAGFHEAGQQWRWALPRNTSLSRRDTSMAALSQKHSPFESNNFTYLLDLRLYLPT